MAENKRCCSCKEYKDISFFSSEKTKKDGLSSKCRSCNTKRYAKWRENNRAKYNAKQYAHRKKFPDKEKARALVRRALLKGSIQKGICFCGNDKVHAHHDDYSKPLEVRWLCITHHEQVHHEK